MLQLLFLLCSFGIIAAFFKSIYDIEKQINPINQKSYSSSDEEACLDPIVEINVKRLRDRSRLGVAKYKSTLYENNTKDIQGWITDTQEELLDAVNYLEKIKQTL